MPVGRLTGEDIVVIFFSLLGLMGSVLLYHFGFPSIMVSVFLSAGITALVYRFLGGIQGAKFALGALKLGGTIAVLIGVAYWMDKTNELGPEQMFRVASDDAVVGRWNWKAVFPNAGWDGELDFIKSGGQLTFTGQESALVPDSKGGTYYKPVFEMVNGKAVLLQDGTHLALESDVKNFQYNVTYHWKSEVPLVLVPAFGGQLWPKSGIPSLDNQPWGILITKDAR
jgi:hypothetical protein